MANHSLKFEIVYSDLKNKILLGKYNATQRLESEGDLALLYKCSRPTVRKALDRLQNEGYIRIKQGSGSYINSKADFDETLIQSPVIQKDSFLGLIFPDLGNGYIFESLVNFIATYLSNKGHSLIWGGCLSPHSETFFDDINQICKRYVQLGIKGVFFSPFEYTNQKDEVNHLVLSMFAQANIPVVLIDSDIDSFPKRNAFDLVSLDHIADSYKLCDHMLSQGIKRLLFLAPPASMQTIRLRLIGYHEALIDHGVPLNTDWFIVCNPSDKSEIEKVLALHKPEGIVCSNDGTAVRLMRTLNDLGVKVPDEMLLGGFDNLSYISEFKLPLTSIMQPVQALGEIAVRTLFQRIATPKSPIQTIRLNGKLIVRETTIRPHWKNS